MARGEPTNAPEGSLVLQNADVQIIQQLFDEVQFHRQGVQQLGLEAAQRMKVEVVHQDMLERHH